MRKYLNSTTFIGVVGFGAGYLLGRRYDVTVTFKKVASNG